LQNSSASDIEGKRHSSSLMPRCEVRLHLINRRPSHETYPFFRKGPKNR